MNIWIFHMSRHILSPSSCAYRFVHLIFHRALNWLNQSIASKYHSHILMNYNWELETSIPSIWLICVFHVQAWFLNEVLHMMSREHSSEMLLIDRKFNYILTSLSLVRINRKTLDENSKCAQALLCIYFEDYVFRRARNWDFSHHMYSHDRTPKM